MQIQHWSTVSRCQCHWMRRMGSASRCGIFIPARDASIKMRARAKRVYHARARQAATTRSRATSGYHGHACQAATTRSRAKVAAGPRARAPSGYHAPLTERLSAQGAKHNKIRIRYPQHYLDLFLCAQSCSCVRSPAVASVRVACKPGQRVTQPPRRQALAEGGGQRSSKQTTNPPSSRTLRRSAQR